MLATLMIAAALGAPMSAEVHVGTRDSFNEDGLAEGLRLGGGFGRGAWGVLVDGYVAAGTERISGDVTTVVTILALDGIDLVMPEDVDQVTLSALARWAPGPRAARDHRPWGRPVVLLGVEARSVNRLAVGWDGTAAVVVQHTPYLTAGLAGGFGLEAGPGGPFGLRLGVLDRTRFAPGLSADGSGLGEGYALHHDPTVALDLCWSFGGGAS